MKLLIFIYVWIVLGACERIQKEIDIYGLNSSSNEILSSFEPGNADSLKSFVNKFDLDRATSPMNYQKPLVLPLKKWTLEGCSSEKWIFPSAYQYNAEQNNAVFYVFKQSKLAKSKTILWVPGSGVSDFAFLFIKDFFQIEINNAYNIIVYIPAYHIERKEIGKENSQGFITASSEQNINNILKATRELRSIIGYLKAQKVEEIGAWAGSMGVSMLLLTEYVEPSFSHLCLMIPVLDWRTIMTGENSSNLVLDSLNAHGFSIELLKKAYGLISPVNYSLKTNPKKLQILYAKYDQLNPVDTILNYCSRNNITNVKAYPKSHATILIGHKMFKDYDEFLKSLE